MPPPPPLPTEIHKDLESNFVYCIVLTIKMNKKQEKTGNKDLYSLYML